MGGGWRVVESKQSKLSSLSYQKGFRYMSISEVSYHYRGHELRIYQLGHCFGPWTCNLLALTGLGG